MDVHQLLEQLLVAEISNRIPVVYWGTNCLYNGAIHNNAFDLYFDAVSHYTIEDLMNPEYTFYPPVWEYDNLMADDPDRSTLIYRNMGDYLESDANVVVCDTYSHIHQIIPSLCENNPAYGMNAIQVYRFLMRNKLKIKDDIKAEIQQFYEKHLQNERPTLAVHVRGDFSIDHSALIRELNRIFHSEFYKIQRSDQINANDTVKLHEIALIKRIKQSQKPNKDYHKEILRFLGKYNIKKIFLTTDSEEVLEEYKKLYGDMLVTTDCSRMSQFTKEKFHYLDTHLTRRRKGMEILKDTYLASMCDFFLGNGYSNFSHAVTRLKDWSETNIKLLYWILDKKILPEYEVINEIQYPENDFIDHFKRMSLFTSDLLNFRSRQ